MLPWASERKNGRAPVFLLACSPHQSEGDNGMNVWDVSSAYGRNQAADAIMANLIQYIGEPDFDTLALAEINRMIPVGSWSVYRLAPNHPLAMHLSASYRVPDRTRECWQTYCRQGVYRTDTTFSTARRRAYPDHLLMGHWSAADIHPLHRDQIYIRHGLRERVSLFSVDAKGDLLAINLYRHDHQPAYTTAELTDLRALAHVISACVRRHIRWQHADEVPATGEVPLRQRLRALCPALTQREIEVCERLLRGYSHDGVAADLGVSLATVKTYRNRAFTRLGIRFRSELFALVFNTQPQARPPVLRPAANA